MPASTRPVRWSRGKLLDGPLYPPCARRLVDTPAEVPGPAHRPPEPPNPTATSSRTTAPAHRAPHLLVALHDVHHAWPDGTRRCAASPSVGPSATVVGRTRAEHPAVPRRRRPPSPTRGHLRCPRLVTTLDQNFGPAPPPPSPTCFRRPAGPLGDAMATPRRARRARPSTSTRSTGRTSRRAAEAPDAIGLERRRPRPLSPPSPAGGGARAPGRPAPAARAGDPALTSPPTTRTGRPRRLRWTSCRTGWRPARNETTSRTPGLFGHQKYQL